MQNDFEGLHAQNLRLAIASLGLTRLKAVEMCGVKERVLSVA